MYQQGDRVCYIQDGHEIWGTVGERYTPDSEYWNIAWDDGFHGYVRVEDFGSYNVYSPAAANHWEEDTQEYDRKWVSEVLREADREEDIERTARTLWLADEEIQNFVRERSEGRADANQRVQDIAWSRDELGKKTECYARARSICSR